MSSQSVHVERDAFQSPSERAKEKLARLSRIPLFTGMSMDELQRVVGKTKIDFLKFGTGDTIVRQGGKCGRLMVLIDGTITCNRTADDGSYDVTETLQAPVALQTGGMFGLFQQCTHTITALTPASVMSVDKKELLQWLSFSVIFRLNLVNSLSTSLQKRNNDLWRPEGSDLKARVTGFFRRHCLTPSGHKTFHIRMTTLATELNASRLDISITLNAMQKLGLLALHRGRIEIPAMQSLLA